MKLIKLLILLLTIALTACEKSNGVSQDDYNQQVNKYNELVETYNNTINSNADLHGSINQHLSNLLKLDSQMKVVSTNYFALSSTSSCQAYKSFDTDRASALKTIIELESQNLKLVQNLRSNLTHTSADKTSGNFDLLKTTLDLEKELTGFRSTLDSMQTTTRLAMHSACNPNTDKEIEISAEEKVILIERWPSRPTAIIYNVHGGQNIAIGDQEIITQSVAAGFSLETVRQNLDLANLSNGVLGVVSSSSELVSVMIDQLAVIKDKMNQNAGNLDLVFIIDYSDSMENNIKSIIKNLQEFNNSLKAIKQSGRRIKFAIVSFGHPGKEIVDLDFTEDITTVDAILRHMLQRFSSSQHSVEPGEASYHGLDLALKHLQWKSSNREIILITDEPSYEASLGIYSMMGAISLRLGNTSVHPIIVRITK